MKRDNFKMRKFKKTSAGIKVIYDETTVLPGDVTSSVETEKKFKDEAHPDLTNALEAFSEIVAYDEGYEYQDDITVTGVTLLNGNKTVILTHLKEIKSGKTARNSGRISLEDNEESEFEKSEELAELIKKLTHEVFEYVFKGKRAQLDMFSEEEEEEEEEKALKKAV